MQRKKVLLGFTGRLFAGAILLTVLGAAMTLSGMFRGNYDEKPLPTVKGVEADGLLAGKKGFLITPRRGEDGRKSEMGVWALPEMQETILRPTTEGRSEIIDSFSGPDEEGRIAYFHSTLGSTYLKVIGADGGGDEIIFKESGGFADVPFEDLALSPRGGLAAFIRKAKKGVQLPGAYLSAGNLEIWDLKRKVRLELPAMQALCSGSLSPFLSWFPDGRKLAYVEVVSPKKVPHFPAGFGQEMRGWPEIPAVHILHLNSGKKEVVHPGWGPIVSEQGRWMLLRDNGNRYRKLKLASRRSEAVDWPGRWYGGAIALLEPNLIVYWGFPTEGAPIRRSPFGSFKAGTQLITIKAADLATGRFQTLVPFIDPRWEASLGMGKQ